MGRAVEAGPGGGGTGEPDLPLAEAVLESWPLKCGRGKAAPNSMSTGEPVGHLVSCQRQESWIHPLPGRGSPGDPGAGEWGGLTTELLPGQGLGL